MDFSSCDLPPRLLTACLLGCGGCLLGVLFLLALPASARRSVRYAALLAFSLAGLAGASAMLDKPWALWLPPMFTSAAWLLAQLRHWPLVKAVAGWTARSLQKPGWQITLFLAVSPVVLVGLLLPPADPDIPIHCSATSLSAPRPRTPSKNLTLYALTDLDSPIPLLALPSQESAGNLAEVEDSFVTGLSRNQPMLIRTAPAEAGQNCHAWIFTGGCYWLDGTNVRRILDENGYRRIHDPHPGDLAVYAGASGEVTHTAVVRMVLEDGLVLLESKWGQLGRYLHPPAGGRFHGPPAYYRSSRQGHLLRGMPGSLSLPASGAKS
jgi:hypothetical protein